MESRPISPAEPIKKHPPPIQPNAHPYAIKTTSSALLSRSNSSPHSAHHTRHHYIPSPPSRLATGTRVRHRHSSSLSSVEGEMLRDVNGACITPAPLPTPQPIVAASRDDLSASPKCADESKLSHRVQRGETMSNSVTESITENHSYERFGHDQVSKPELYAALPPNPKKWDTDELTTYLQTSFKLGSNTDGDKDDSNLVEILECVRARGLTGRELLRLTDADLAGIPLSDVQRAQLLEHSRILRADVLRGCIYVDSYHSHEVSNNSRCIYSQSARSSAPFHSVRGNSVSADDLRLLLDNNTSDGQDALPSSPVLSLHRSNSVSDASAQRYRDLARMRTRRRGRVKGLIETWERTSTSGSEYSASETESESETDPEIESISDAKHPPEPPSVLPSEPPQSVCLSVDSSALVPQKPPLSTPPYANMDNTLDSTGNEEEEPSIEELLASSPNTPLKGWRAWEADFGLGDTVKRISVSGSVDAGSPFPLVTEQDTPHLQDDGKQTQINGDSVRSKGMGMRRNTGSRGKAQGRVVTAIFTGSPSDDVSGSPGDEAHSGHHHRASGPRVVRDEVPASLDPQNDMDNALRVLEESIAVTRFQLEAFKLRLEDVESDTARHEAMLMRTQLSDSCHSSEFETRQRRSEANETTEPPVDQTFIEGARNRDSLEGWDAMSLADIARTIVVGTVGWLFPFGHLGVRTSEDHNKSRARSGSRSGANDKYHPSGKGSGRLQVARMSCSIILVSFAICAAVLRRMGFGQWVRRP